MPTTIAFDVDLGRVHAWSSLLGEVCYSAQGFPIDVLMRHDRVLVEVASPRIEGRTSKERYNRVRWALFNMSLTTDLYSTMLTSGCAQRLLVSPSDKWTRGHPEDIRREIAGATARNHDLRECQTMLFFYGTNPEQWIPFPAHLSNLVSK